MNFFTFSHSTHSGEATPQAHKDNKFLTKLNNWTNYIIRHSTTHTDFPLKLCQLSSHFSVAAVSRNVANKYAAK